MMICDNGVCDSVFLFGRAYISFSYLKYKVLRAAPPVIICPFLSLTFRISHHPTALADCNKRSFCPSFLVLAFRGFGPVSGGVFTNFYYLRLAFASCMTHLNSTDSLPLRDELVTKPT